METRTDRLQSVFICIFIFIIMHTVVFIYVFIYANTTYGRCFALNKDCT